MKNPHTRNYLLLHFIVFIWGWTAILGKLIEAGTMQLVLYRLPIAVSGILLYIAYKKISLKISYIHFLRLTGVGLIIVIHWLCFYGSVKVANVSIALACFSAGSLFTAIIEPLFYKRKIVWYEIVFGLMVIGTLALIFNVEAKYKLGILLGIAAAFTSSLFGVINGVLVNKGYHPERMSLYELGTGFIALFFYLLFTSPETVSISNISSSDWMYLIVLGWFCTSLPFLISVNILKNISPYTISLTLNLETIYGILFAFFIFNEQEQMTTTFYIGTGIILSTIFANAILKNYYRSKTIKQIGSKDE